MQRFKLTFLLSVMLVLLACTSDKVEINYESENIIIVVIDGPRYSETWGEPNHAYIPHQSALQSQGVLFTNFHNEGVTYTVPGHVALTTGVYQEVNNGGLEIPKFPSIFQYWRKAYSKNATDAWVIASKDKLAVLANCSLSGWKDQYMPSTDCGVNGLGTGYRDDSITIQRSINILTEHHPNLVLINFREPDYSGHTNDWNAYIQGLMKSDQYLQQLWEFIEADPIYQGKTTLFITNDHGRHLDGINGGFGAHGDDCLGCRKIGLLAIGPDFNKGTQVDVKHSQIDIPKTIMRMMKLPSPNNKGQVLTGLFK